MGIARDGDTATTAVTAPGDETATRAKLAGETATRAKLADETATRAKPAMEAAATRSSGGIVLGDVSATKAGPPAFEDDLATTAEGRGRTMRGSTK